MNILKNLITDNIKIKTPSPSNSPSQSLVLTKKKDSIIIKPFFICHASCKFCAALL